MRPPSLARRLAAAAAATCQLGPVAAGDAAGLDDAEEPVPVGRVDAPAVQAGRGQRQQPAQHQFGDRHGAQPGPEHRGVDAEAGAGVEVLLGRVERHLRPDRPVLLGQGADESEVERRVGQDVGDRRAGRQHPVLHPQVRPAVHHRVDGPVPPVDRAVVQGQLGQRRRAALRQHRGRVLVVADRQQRREVAHVLLEEVEDRGDPALAEPDPGPYPLRAQLLGPGVGRLLEQRDAGLAPQLVTEQEGRVGPQRHLHAGQGLGRVPVGGEVLRRHLGVQLGAGAGGLGRDRVGLHAQPVHPGDLDHHVLATGGEDLVVDQRVARVGRERLLGEVLALQGRQDADHHQVHADGGRPLPRRR